MIDDGVVAEMHTDANEMAVGREFNEGTVYRGVGRAKGQYCKKRGVLFMITMAQQV